MIKMLKVGMMADNLKNCKIHTSILHLNLCLYLNCSNHNYCHLFDSLKRKKFLKSCLAIVSL